MSTIDRWAAQPPCVTPFVWWCCLAAAFLSFGGCKAKESHSDPHLPPGTVNPPAQPAAMQPGPPTTSQGPTGPAAQSGPPGAVRDAGAGPVDEDAGSETTPPAADGGPPQQPVEPTCVDGEWRLAPGFLPAKRIDYLADRMVRVNPDAGTVGSGGSGGSDFQLQTETVVLSETGKACANASNRAACSAALAVVPQLNRHLATTAGNDVRVWPPLALGLLGKIDTDAEAIWVVLNSRSNVPCSATVERDGDDYLVGGLPNFSCPQLADGGMTNTSSARVLPNGQISEVLNDAGVSAGACPPLETPPQG